MKVKQLPDKLICESCGEEFSCGADVGKCWCFEVELEPETLANLREDFDKCLCRNCLKKLNAAHNLKTKPSFVAMTVIVVLVFCFSINAQEFNLTKFINETRAVARKTGYQSFFEFTYDFKRTNEKKNGEKSSDTLESVCSQKHCERVLIAKNGKALSEKKIRKNRERAAQRLEKDQFLPENRFYASKEIPSGYFFMIATSYGLSNSLFSPSVYLTNCQVKFVEKVLVEKRPTRKLSAAQCNLGNDKPNNLLPFTPETEGLTSNVYNEVNKNLLQFLPETEALIWVDEQDKAVTQIEVYYKNKTSLSPVSTKPVVVMKAERIPEGFWFWKLITINALENEKFFPRDYGNWQIELFNYKSYKVLIEKVVFDKNQ